MTKDVYVRYLTVAPILHSEPKLKAERKNDSEQRTINVLTKNDDGLLEARRHPVVSGNSIRCKNRRAFMRSVLEYLGLTDQGCPTGLPNDIVYLLEAGGATDRGAGKKLAPADFMQVYDVLPFFGLFGGSYQSVFFPGRLSVGFAYPVTRGTRRILKAMGSPFADSESFEGDAYSLGDSSHNYNRMPIRELDDNGNQESRLGPFIAHMQAEDDNFENVGLQDLDTYLLEPENKSILKRAKDFWQIKIGDPEKAVKSIMGKVEKDGARGLYSVSGAIPPGTYLHTRISLLPGFGNDECMNAVFHAYLETVLANGYLGGMANRGYGAVVAEARINENGVPKNFADISRGEEFWLWLDDNRERVVEFLMNMKELFEDKKPKKKSS